MKEFNQILEIVKKSATRLGKEKVLLSDSLNRVLAEDVRSDINLPPFNKASMDGFACRRSDLPGPFKVVEEIPAGKFPKVDIQKGECARIMTGAPLPKGADTVFLIEYHAVQEDGSITFVADKTDDNVCLLGEDVKEGEIVLAAGTLIQPQEIAILAGAGKANVEVYNRPKVGILSTGTELVEPYENPKLGQIRNSNGHQMLAQIAQMGLITEYFGIVGDSKEEISGKIQSAIKFTDVLFISGGVSVGDYDFVPQVLMELDFDIVFTAMKTKPGKHTLFAKKDDKYILGFPGNPVSSFVQLEFLGKELLYKLMGYNKKQIRYKAVLIDDFKRKHVERLEFLPVQITESGKVILMSYNGSAHINAITNADALMEIPIGVSSYEKGDQVYIRPLKK